MIYHHRTLHIYNTITISYWHKHLHNIFKYLFFFVYRHRSIITIRTAFHCSIMPENKSSSDDNLIKLYEYRIKKQEELVSRLRTGFYHTMVLLPDKNMICGLALGDLKLLKEKLSIYKKQFKAKKTNKGEQQEQNSLKSNKLDVRQDIERLKERALNSQVIVRLDQINHTPP